LKWFYDNSKTQYTTWVVKEQEKLGVAEILAHRGLKKCFADYAKTIADSRFVVVVVVDDDDVVVFFLNCFSIEFLDQVSLFKAATTDLVKNEFSLKKKKKKIDFCVFKCFFFQESVSDHQVDL
jgi:hypothetical protein